MDWWKLFGGTFVLIFLAELGDKTQLAAMAKTADSPDNSMAKWVVFAGASFALVASTFIAVFLGHILKAVVPDERYIKIAAAALFLIFGFSILYETLSSFRTPEAGAAESAAAAAVSGGEHSLAGDLALGAALNFESAAMQRYQRAAEGASPKLAGLLRELAAEEEEHLRFLRNLPAEQKGDEVWESRISPAGTGISGRQPGLPEDDAAVVAALVGNEEATAAFYRELADRTLIPSVRGVLSRLAGEEDDHAKRLRDIGDSLQA